MTLFKEMVDNVLNYSMMARAQKNQLIELQSVDIRDFAGNKHHQVDDYPYGGGAGMLIMAQPVYDCYASIVEKAEGKKPRVLYMTPHGKVWNQQMAESFAQEDNIIILCGHYEGIDQRVIDEIVTDEISMGDFVLTGGELPALVVADSIMRLIPGVLASRLLLRRNLFQTGFWNITIIQDHLSFITKQYLRYYYQEIIKRLQNIVDRNPLLILFIRGLIY